MTAMAKANLPDPTFHLKPGDKTPNIQALDQAGKPVVWKEYEGKKIVLFFYNSDGSETCTKECLNVRDGFKKLKQAGYEVIGCSPDSAKKHTNFITKHKLPYRLIVDKDLEVVKKFGIYGYKKFMGRESMAIHRTTFIIDEAGKIERIIRKVVSAKHTEQILSGED